LGHARDPLLPWPFLRTILAATFAAFSIWALWLTRRPHMRAAFMALLVGVIAWHVAIPPSHDRPWRADLAVMPRAVIDGDRVRISGVRDFGWRTRTDYTVRHTEREVSISHLVSIDFFISYWAPEWGPMAHTFLSFNFDNAAPLAISIEARAEQGEGFEPLPALFKQFELIYVVGEERDIVGVRTTQRQEAVFLYRIQAPAEGARRLFLVYMSRMNELAERPEWYSLFRSNCKINIIRYARAAGWAAGFDFRQYLNGWVDRYLYAEGVLDTALPFQALRARARLHETVQPGEDAPGFSRRIREGRT
jgi:hypothetical protein